MNFMPDQEGLRIENFDLSAKSNKNQKFIRENNMDIGNKIKKQSNLNQKEMEWKKKRVS